VCKRLYRNVRPHSLPAESHSFVGMAREAAAMPPAESRGFTPIQMVHMHTHTHTHTLPQQGRWTENENEVTMPIAQNGQTLKGQGKRKSGRTTGQAPTREGVADGSAWHNLRGKSQTYLGVRRTQTWPNTREHAWNKGPLGPSYKMMHPLLLQNPLTRFNGQNLWL